MNSAHVHQKIRDIFPVLHVRLCFLSKQSMLKEPDEKLTICPTVNRHLMVDPALLSEGPDSVFPPYGSRGMYCMGLQV